MRSTALKVSEELLGKDFSECTSPSLRLTKYLYLEKNGKKTQLEAVARSQLQNGMNIPPIHFTSNAHTIAATLEGSLIVNQAGGILENAGVCLHPHFGGSYIPGSAIKGIARHVAWCEWKKEKDPEIKRQVAKEIARIFGFPTNDRSLDTYLKALREVPRSGAVCFMAAQPEKGGALDLDILTPHGGNDWTDPTPSPFLVVKKGTVFMFTLVPTRGCEKRDFQKAIYYLKYALTTYGIGGKTAAGYGRFSIEGFTQSEEEKTARNYILKLSSPAFLRGATTSSEGILREASLRGLLRWWWRFLYRSIYDEAELKRLETFIWGGAGESSTASKIGIRILQAPRGGATLFNKDAILKRLPRVSQFRTSGLSYLSYGMADGDTHRKVLEPTARIQWQIELFVRHTDDKYVKQVLDHAELALLALCTYGGVGAKARKGFGSLDCDNALPRNLLKCLFTSVNGLPFKTNSDTLRDFSYLACTTTEGDISTIEITLKDPWLILDRIGHAIQAVATGYKHESDKAVLGLPRKIHGPLKSPMRHQMGQWEPPEMLKAEGTLASNIKRYAMPMTIHLKKRSFGYCVTTIIFPSGHVREENTSRTLLQEVQDSITTTLSQWEYKQ